YGIALRGSLRRCASRNLIAETHCLSQIPYLALDCAIYVCRSRKYFSRYVTVCRDVGRGSRRRDWSGEPGWKVGVSAMHGGEAAGERARILAAVRRTTGERGCRGVTTDDLARTAGLSRGRFDAHFRDVEQALVAAQGDFLERLRVQVESSCQTEDSWARQVQ